MRILIRDSVSEFMQIRLANNHRAGLPQRGHDIGIPRRNKIRENLRSRRRADSLRFDIVFERKRNAVKRPAMLAARDFAFGATRVRPRLLRSDGDKCVQLGIKPFDSFEDRIEQFNRRDLPPPQHLRRLADGQKAQFILREDRHAINVRTLSPAAADSQPSRGSRSTTRRGTDSPCAPCREKAAGIRIPARSKIRCK